MIVWNVKLLVSKLASLDSRYYRSADKKFAFSLLMGVENYEITYLSTPENFQGIPGLQNAWVINKRDRVL